MNDKAQTKAQRKQLAIQNAKAKKNKMIIGAVVLAGVVAAGAYGFIAQQNAQREKERAEYDKTLASANKERVILEKETSYPIQSRDHVGANQPHEAFTTNPPTSGPHSAPARGGFFSGEVTDEQAIHNLEHGYVWLTYKNIPSWQIDEIEALAKKYAGQVMASERPDNETNGVILVAWGKMLTLSKFDEKIAEAFIARNYNQSPERLAR